MKENMQNAGFLVIGCNRNGGKPVPQSWEPGEIRNPATIVPDERSGKEVEKGRVSDSALDEIHQKISNCAFCSKLAHNRPGQSTEYTSSQFSNEKLQKRVDSVECLWYSNDISLESGVVCRERGALIPGMQLVYFVECGENEWIA